MTDLYSNVPTFRLTRDASNNNNVNTGDNAWLKIKKNKNELAKVELMNRSLINSSDTVIREIGFPRFQINNSGWVDSSTNIKDISGNDNIIILDFEDSTMEKRNFLNDESDDSLPNLKYLVVRLKDSNEILSDIVGTSTYYNYIFSGDIIGPKEFLDFNTNYCIREPGSGNFLYTPVNWCSLERDEVNSYTNLNLNVNISPKYDNDTVSSSGHYIITSKLSIIKTSYTPPDATPQTTFYDDGIYELNNLLWCSLNSPRHLKLKMISKFTNNSLIQNGIGVYRYIQNFIYDDISVNYSSTPPLQPLLHKGNRGGGYRKTSGTLELVRETTEPYYFDTSTTEFHSLPSGASDIWSMRSHPLEDANYFEIRYKPLVPINPINPITGVLSIQFEFGKTNESITTFERYTGMDGTLLPTGTTYKFAKRETESIKLEWKGTDPDSTIEKSIILFDVASGYFKQNAIIATNTNEYADIITTPTNFDIQTYVYQFRLEDPTVKDPTTPNSFKLFNKAIKPFSETRNNKMVIDNKRFNLFLYPKINNPSVNNPSVNNPSINNIFQYDDTVTGINNKTNPLTDIENVFSVKMKLEKFFMTDGITTQNTTLFNNAVNLLGDNVNIGLLQSKNIYISGKTASGISVYSNADGVIEQSPPTIDIVFSSLPDPLTMINISLGKGLINSSLNTEDAFINERSFLFKLKQNFLSDYWKFNTVLSDLATNTIIDTSFKNFEIQRKVAASISVIDLYLSGQIFLINTASNKSDVSYIPTIVSDTILPSKSGNPSLNFDFVENIPSLNNVYLKLSNIDSTGNPIDITNTFYNGSTNNNYQGTLSNTITGTTTINQPLNTTTNIFDVNTIFSNTGSVDRTLSTNTTPTQYNGIYYFDIQSSDHPQSNPTLKNMIIYPGTIQVNLVELPDIIYDPDETTLKPDNKSITISWPRYYFDNSQGKITWTIIKQDMATLVLDEKTYDRNSTEISIVGDKIQFIDTKIRIYDKYQYTVSGEFVYDSYIKINTIQKNFSLSLSITGFTTDTIFVCKGYTNRFPFGRFNTTSTNFKLFAPKLLRTDINETTRNLFASQLLLTNPVPTGYAGTEKDWLNQMDSWPGGRGSCGDNVIISGQNTQVNENIYANTSDQLSKKQIYNFLSKSRFRPDR